MTSQFNLPGGRGFRDEGGPALRIDERKHGIVRVARGIRKINLGPDASTPPASRLLAVDIPEALF
jgi:hypothetical protein